MTHKLFVTKAESIIGFFIADELINFAVLLSIFSAAKERNVVSSSAPNSENSSDTIWTVLPIGIVGSKLPAIPKFSTKSYFLEAIVFPS